MLKIDMNKFKSIWRLMLGILLLGITGQERPGYPHNEIVIFEAHEDKEHGALL